MWSSVLLSSQKIPYIQAYLFQSNGKNGHISRSTLLKQTGGEGPSERKGKCYCDLSEYMDLIWVAFSFSSTWYLHSFHNTSQDLSDWSSSFWAGRLLVLPVSLADWKLSSDKPLAEEAFLPGASQQHELRQSIQGKQQKNTELNRTWWFHHWRSLAATISNDIISLVLPVSRVFGRGGGGNE